MKKAYLLILITFIVISACKNKEEQKNAIEDKAQFLAETKARAAKGVGEAMKGEGKSAADSLSEGVGEVIKGGNSGIDKSLNAIKVDVDSLLADAGISLGRTARLEKKNAKGQEGVTLYFIFNKAFNGTLMLKALDAKGTETGRTTLAVKGAADSTRYIDFYFDERTPLSLAAKYSLSKK